MSCAPMPCSKPQHCFTCLLPCCVKRPAKARSRPPNRASAGSSLKLTLSLTWNGSTLVTGKRR